MTNHRVGAAARAGGVSTQDGDAAWGSLAVVGLVLSATALLSAPLLMPAGYSWVSNTTSESAAQGVPGAWLARGGFVLFGSAVLVLCRRCGHRWGRLATACHGVFGLCWSSPGSPDTGGVVTGIMPRSRSGCSGRR